jgi:hypothetical protein
MTVSTFAAYEVQSELRVLILRLPASVLRRAGRSAVAVAINPKESGDDRV